MTANTAVIQIEQLSKTYQRSRKEQVDALKGLNLTIQQGEIFGYLGPNGAGKTTTIRLLLDLIRPTTGRALLFGQDARANSVALHRRIGFLPGELNLWKAYTGQQVLDYVGKLRGGVDAAYVRQLVDRLQFDPTLKVRTYSSGNKRKLGLVLALMNRADLLIMDEPTGGLDPLMQQIFNELMLDVKAEGRTVFLSSHVLSEVQAICDRVGILRGGELKAVESVSNLMHADFQWVTLHFREPVAANALAQVVGVSEVQALPDGLRLRLVGDFDPLLRALAPYYVTGMVTEEPTLEEVFLTYYSGTSGKEATR
jgi:ABC-2 type transport system ATP-binding protein